MPGQEGALALTREEAEVLAFALGGHWQARPRRTLAHLRLGQIGEREAKPRERLRPQGGEHVGLVLGGVRRRGQQRSFAVVGDARVVAGRERRRPQPPREGEHRVDPQLAVADHARVWGSARLVTAHEALDDRGAKVILQVQGQVRKPEAVRERACPQDGLR